MTVPARRPVDDALDRLAGDLRSHADVYTYLDRDKDAAAVRSELQRLREERDEWEKIAEDRARYAHEQAERMGRLREGLRMLLDCKGWGNGTVGERGGYPAVCTKCEAEARALLSASPSGGEPCPFCGFQGPFDGHVCEPVLCGCGDPENCRYATAEEHADSPADEGGAK